ncbi:hypothetical protein LguiB_012460 [Lonicera macranthoides]
MKLYLVDMYRVWSSTLGPLHRLEVHKVNVGQLCHRTSLGICSVFYGTRWIMMDSGRWKEKNGLKCVRRPLIPLLINDGIRDETCSSLSSRAIWTRGWTGEENRHGDLLNKHLYLCGRVDMKQVEKTIQYFIGSVRNGYQQALPKG